MSDYHSLLWNLVILVRYMQLKHKKCANVKTLNSIDRFIQLNSDSNICRAHLRRLYFQHISRIEDYRCCKKVTIDVETMITSNCERNDQLFRLKRRSTRSCNHIWYYCIHFTNQRASISKNSLHHWYFSSWRYSESHDWTVRHCNTIQFSYESCESCKSITS